MKNDITYCAVIILEEPNGDGHIAETQSVCKAQLEHNIKTYLEKHLYSECWIYRHVFYGDVRSLHGWIEQYLERIGRSFPKEKIKPEFYQYPNKKYKRANWFMNLINRILK